MADENKGKEDKVVVAEFNVSMHCNACERTVAKTISKIKGVEKFVTDMNRHKVIVTGEIKPEKVLKKLNKKTGKRAEMVLRKENDSKDEQKVKDDDEEELATSMVLGYFGGDNVMYTMFSDENPNAACSIM